MKLLPIFLVLALVGAAQATTYLDLYNNYNRTQGSNNVWFRDELGGDMTFTAPGSWNASGFPVAGFTNSTTYGKIIGNTGTGGGNQPYTMVVWQAPESKTAGYYVSLSVINTGGQTLTVGLYHNASLVTSVTAAAGARADLNYLVSNVAKSANLTVRFSVSTTQTAFGIYSFRIGDSPQNLQVLAFNELTQAVLGYNLTITNSSNQTSFLVVPAAGLNRTLLEIPTGVVTFEFRNYTCLTGSVIPRSFVLTLNVGMNQTEASPAGYLLCDGSIPVSTGFYVVDTSDRPLTDVLVTLKRSFSGSLKTVTSRYTDATGLIALYLDQTTSYQVTAEKSGYSTFQSSIIPSSSTYTIRLGNVNDTIGFQTIFDNLFYSILPDPAVLSGNFSNLSFYLNDSLGQLNFWGWNVTYQGLGLYDANWTNNFTGGFDYVTVNMTDGNKTGNVTVFYWFSRANFTLWNSTRTFLLNPTNVTDSSLVSNLASPKANGASNLFLTLIWAVIAAWVTAPFSRIVGRGSGVIALLVLAIGTFMGHVSMGIFGLTCITVVSYYGATSGY